MIGGPHYLFLGSSEVSPSNPPAVREAPIKVFEVFYDTKVIVGFHVIAEAPEEPEVP